MPLIKVAQAQLPAAETHTKTQVPQEPPAPLFKVAQTPAPAPEPQVKPFAPEEDAPFKTAAQERYGKKLKSGTGPKPQPGFFSFKLSSAR